MKYLSKIKEKNFIYAEDKAHVTYLNPHPITPGTSFVESKNNNATRIFQLSLDEYKQLMLSAKNIALHKSMCFIS